MQVKKPWDFGDVKLLAVLGLYFGVALTISVSIISFIVAGIISLIIMKSKKKNKNEYIAFGPYMVIAAFICIVIPEKTIISILLTIFTLGRYRYN